MGSNRGVSRVARVGVRQGSGIRGKQSCCCQVPRHPTLRETLDDILVWSMLGGFDVRVLLKVEANAVLRGRFKEIETNCVGLQPP